MLTSSPVTPITPNTATQRPPAGDPLARTLFSVYSGTPVTLVDSPPGAGKTTLIINLIDNIMATNPDTTITVAVSTNNQGVAIVNRLAERIPELPLQMSSGIRDHRNATVTASVLGAKVAVRTIASCTMKRPVCDLLIVEEAYQIVFADVAEAAQESNQLLIVGDPGQIGPVIPFKITAWQHMRTQPNLRAPEAFKHRPGTKRIPLPSTYRLGPQTAWAIAPLYDFDFDSKRVFQHIENQTSEVTAIKIPVREKAFDTDTLNTVFEQAMNYINTPYTVGTQTRPLTDEDVAVIVALNAQASALDAMFTQAGAKGITVGTADRLQGGQWPAVVALDPSVAYGSTEHHLSSGRLCVMASRHSAHLTWVYDETWEETLTKALDDTESQKGYKVRTRLLT